MDVNSAQDLVKTKRGAFKQLITPQSYRDIRLQILEEQGRSIGWKPDQSKSDISLPTFPFIFAWTGEQGYEVRPCRWAGQRPAVWQPHRPNVGRPEFTNPLTSRSAFHVVRQRKGVMADLCSFCGEPIDTSDVLWMHIASDTAVHPDGWADLKFPHFHLECIRQTFNGCPFFRAGFGGFAPYKGPVRKTYFSCDKDDMARLFSLNVHRDAQVVVNASYQVPANEMVRLRELATMGCPDGLHYMDANDTTG